MRVLTRQLLACVKPLSLDNEATNRSGSHTPPFSILDQQGKGMSVKNRAHFVSLCFFSKGLTSSQHARNMPRHQPKTHQYMSSHRFRALCADLRRAGLYRATNLMVINWLKPTAIRMLTRIDKSQTISGLGFPPDWAFWSWKSQ